MLRILEARVSPKLDAARQQAARILLFGTWLMVPIVGGSSFWVGNGLLTAPAIATVFAVLGTLGYRQGGGAGRISIGLASIGQAIALTAAFSGHPWQLDSHMFFFAVLAAQVALVDVRMLLASAALVVAHHLVLSLAIPGLIYPSTGVFENVARTLFHGAILIVELAALIGAVRIRMRMDLDGSERQKALEQSRKQAEEEQREALALKDAAETAKAKSEAMLSDLEAAKQREDEARLRAKAEAEEVAAADARMQAEREAERKAQDDVVSALRARLASLSAGDLASTVDAQFGESYEDLRFEFNSATAQLQQTVAMVVDSSDDILDQSTGISAAADALAKRTETQAAALEETAASIDELTKSVKNAADMAGEASDVAKGAEASAEDSQRVVKDALNAMDLIEESSKQIAQIISVIEEIAFQTNLLALNAGVEAARAGEAGRGFSVVASEVRALAQRASDAAKDIGDLITTSTEQVADGVKMVEEAGNALTGIVQVVENIGEKVSSIAQISGEQANGIEEINRAINDLDQVTQQNAAMFEETNAACATLKDTSNQLKEELSKFQVKGGEDRSTATAA